MTDMQPYQQSGIPSPDQWQSILSMTATIYQSGLAPKEVQTAEQAAVIALKGLELDLPPMQALSHIHVIQGKPTLSAELMGALVQRAGHTIRVIESTDDRCELHGIRSNDRSHTTRIVWDMERARKAKLGGDNWQKYPAAMLRSRAMSELCRAVFQDVLMGASYTPDELGADVQVEDDGTITVVDVARDEPDSQTVDDDAYQQAFAAIVDKLASFEDAFADTQNPDALATFAADKQQLARVLRVLDSRHEDWLAERDGATA